MVAPQDSNPAFVTRLYFENRQVLTPWRLLES